MTKNKSLTNYKYTVLAMYADYVGYKIHCFDGDNFVKP